MLWTQRIGCSFQCAVEVQLVVKLDIHDVYFRVKCVKFIKLIVFIGVWVMKIAPGAVTPE